MIFLLVSFFVAIEAVFTALEVALGATPRARWRTLSDEAYETEREAESAEEIRRARRLRFRANNLARLTEHPERLSLLFISITTLALWTAASLLASHALREQWSWWHLAGSFVGVLFAAEVLPLLIAAHHGEKVALGLANPVIRVLRMLKPLLLIPSGLGTVLARVLGARPEATTQVTTNELRTALAAAEEEGVIESEERAMLEGAIAFREKPVHTVMTPIQDVIAVREDDELGTVLRISLDEGHSRLPVLAASGGRDTIRGVLATKDLLRPLRTGADGFTARHAIRPAFFLAADTPIATALERLRHERTLMAVVVQDQKPLGIVTLEDLLEELVGEIEDEWDDEAALRLEAPPGPGPAGTVATLPEFIVVCDRPHEVTIREIERFWREHGEGLLRLRTEAGELAPPDETLDDYVLRYLPAPRAGQSARVGESRFESEDEDANADERATPAKSDVTLAVADVELEIRALHENRVQTLAIREVPRAVEIAVARKGGADAAEVSE